MEWRYFRGKIVKSRLLKKSPQKLHMQSLGKKVTTNRRKVV